MIFRILLYAFLVYLLYKTIFELIVPVYKTTRHLKKGFREMNDKMNDYMKNQQQESRNQNNAEPSTQKHSEDYIEFEEIK